MFSKHDLVNKFVWVDLGKSFAKVRPCSLKKGGGIERPVTGHLDGRGVISKSTTHRLRCITRNLAANRTAGKINDLILR